MEAQSETRKTGWLTLREGEAYSITLGPGREFFLLREEDGWCLWWGWWTEGKTKPIKEKTLASGLSFSEALKRGNDYVDWWFKRTKGRRRK